METIRSYKTNPVLDFIGNGSIFISIAAISQTWFACDVLGIKNKLPWCLINFFATLIIYNGQRLLLSSKKLYQNARNEWYLKNKRWLYAIMFSALIEMIVFVFQIPWRAWAHYGILLMISIGYFWPALNLRSIPFLKSLFIAFVWVASSCIIPWYNDDPAAATLNKSTVGFFASQFIFIWVLCIPFDIRDLHFDSEKHIKSMPVIIGVRRSKLVALALGLLYILCYYYVGNKQIIWVGRITFLFIMPVMRLTNENRHPYFYAFLVDGIILLQAFVYYVLTYLL